MNRIHGVQTEVLAIFDRRNFFICHRLDVAALSGGARMCKFGKWPIWCATIRKFCVSNVKDAKRVEMPGLKSTINGNFFLLLRARSSSRDTCDGNSIGDSQFTSTDMWMDGVCSGSNNNSRGRHVSCMCRVYGCIAYSVKSFTYCFPFMKYKFYVSISLQSH